MGILNEKIETRRTTLKSKHQTLQPFMVLVENAATSHSSYVVINDTCYYVETPVKALDVCFKIFFSLNVKYPVECEQVWTFIQEFIYKIKSTKRYAGVTVVSSEISAILNSHQN